MAGAATGWAGHERDRLQPSQFAVVAVTGPHIRAQPSRPSPSGSIRRASRSSALVARAEAARVLALSAPASMVPRGPTSCALDRRRRSTYVAGRAYAWIPDMLLSAHPADIDPVMATFWRYIRIQLMIFVFGCVGPIFLDHFLYDTTRSVHQIFLLGRAVHHRGRRAHRPRPHQFQRPGQAARRYPHRAGAGQAEAIRLTPRATIAPMSSGGECDAVWLGSAGVVVGAEAAVDGAG